MSVTLFSPDPDVKLAVELGMCLLLGKPILLVVGKGDVVPPTLAKVAAEIVVVDWANTASSRTVIIAAIERMAAMTEGA